MLRVAHLLTVLALALIISKPSFGINPKEGFKEGFIVLTSGDVIKGKVLPLAKYNESGTSFKNENGIITTIPHHKIAKVFYDNQAFYAKTIQLQGKSIDVYANLVEGGNTSLWKTYFYDEKNIGKNNTIIQFQQGWLIKSPVTGHHTLALKPRSNQVAQALQHPMVTLEINNKHTLTEIDLKSAVATFNSSVVQLNLSKKGYND